VPPAQSRSRRFVASLSEQVIIFHMSDEVPVGTPDLVCSSFAATNTLKTEAEWNLASWFLA
jgi:hypothetical protein